MITKEMESWLSANREQYEWYVLHAMLHDKERALRFLTVPLKPSDFGTDAAALLFAAIRMLNVLGSVTGAGVSFPPNMLELKDALTAAAGPEEMGDDVIAEVMGHAFTLLLRTSMEPRWKVIDAYFEVWLTSVRSKEYARQVQMRKVSDTPALISKLQSDLQAARSAVQPDTDDMDDLFEGTDETPIRRRTTGITALDEALNGGWGEKECYLLFAGTGGGKCHGKGTLILMWDGTLKRVEDVVVGDLLMGPDSTPRRVRTLARGKDEMFEIRPKRGAASVVVSSEHMLTLSVTNIGSRVVKSSRGVAATTGALIDVAVSDYIRSTPKFRHVTKWVQSSGIEFMAGEESELLVPPYLLGFWLGDGHERVPVISKPGSREALASDIAAAGWRISDDRVEIHDSCETISVVGGMKTALRSLGLLENKHVPHAYLTASRTDRARILAGLLDSDGSVHRSGWEFSNTNKKLIDGVVFLSRSLGHRCGEPAPRITRCQTGAKCKSWRVHIQPTSDLPVRIKIPPKRRCVKNPLTHGFEVIPIGVDDYYGFEVGGNDNRYLLGDFSITHNSILAGQVSWNECSYGGNPLIVSTELMSYEYLARVLSCACSIPIPVFQDCKNFMQMRIKAAQDMTLGNRVNKMEAAYNTLKLAWRVHKVSSDDSMNAKTLLELQLLRYENRLKRRPSLVILDWLGSLADVGGGGRQQSSSDRSAVWEHAANGCVKFAEETGIPTLVLAQATNDASLHSVLTQQHIGVGKGIIKNMVAGIGITNTMDKAGIAAAAKGTADMPTKFTLDEQRLCLVKARKGEGSIIPIERDFRYQRFKVPPPR